MKFYLLRDPKVNSPEDLIGGMDASYAQGTDIGDAPRCPRCGGALGAYKLLPPHRFTLEVWGKHYGDIVRPADQLMISERFMQTFQGAALKGLSDFEPVEIVKVVHRRRRLVEELPRYFMSTVTRSPTAIDQAASGYVWKNPANVCPVCLFDTLRRFDRLVIKEDTWNGDDIFFPRGVSRLMVSDRFKTLCDEHAIRGVVFKDAEQESEDCFPWETEQARQD